MKLVAKVTVKSVIGNVPTEIKEITNEKGEVEKKAFGIKQPLMRVLGVCTGFRKVVTNFGESISFKGEFQATNILTGEIVRGAQLFLPSVAQDLMLPVVDAANGSEVQFAFDIGVEPAGTPHGYEYTVRPLLEVAVSDPLAQLAASLANVPLPALPAPAQASLDVTNESTAEKEVAADSGKPKSKK